ncbi:MAG TPA: ABC transporter permease, partial [Vicinamibacterales bacterium]|nr:ABC transporter permease [Vicinamibacterales bacterium]
VLSAIGGGLGIALALLAQSALTRYAGSAVPVFANVQVDNVVMAFAIGLSLAAPIMFGVAPAFTSSRNEQVTERAQSSSRETRSLRSLLVAGEVALSIVLVVGAVLFLRSLSRLQNVDPGFNREHAIAFTVTLPFARYPDAATRYTAFSDMERRLRHQAGVESTGATSTLALRGTTWSSDGTVEGRGATDYERELQHASTTRDYFTTMGIRLLAGRFFEDTDTRDKPPVTIVNETLARRYFRGVPAQQVVGKRITFGRPQDNSPWNTIVGVVGDEKQGGMDKPPEPTAYSSIAQRQQNPLTFVVRSSQSPDAVIAAARRSVSEVDKDLALTNVTTLAAVVERSMEGHRFRTTLLSVFAAVALLLAALGIYGVLAYFVTQRSRELGIRLALGARPEALFRMVVGQGMRPVAVGAAAGLVGAAGMTSLMRTLLFGVAPIDPLTYGVAIALLGLIATAACALPALRATRVDPLVALREE